MQRTLKIIPIIGLTVFLGGIALISSSGEFRNPAYWTVCGVGTLLFLTVFVQEASRNFCGYVFNGLTALFFAGTLVCLFEIVQNRKLEWDVTAGKLNSLSRQTKEYLRALQTPVHLIAFVNSVEEDEKSVAERLRQYSAQSELVTFEVRDPARDTQAVERLRAENPNLLINYKDTFVVIFGSDAQTEANAATGLKAATETNASSESNATPADQTAGSLPAAVEDAGTFSATGSSSSSTLSIPSTPFTPSTPETRQAGIPALPVESSTPPTPETRSRNSATRNPQPETRGRGKKILRMKKVAGTDEERLINAIVAMVSDRVFQLYFLQNHGEPNIQDVPRQGSTAEPTIITLCRLLHERGFALRPLNLLEREEIPEDCDVLVCLHPQFDLLPVEVERISNWLSAGGRGLFFVNASRRRDVEFANFAGLFGRFGINARYQDVVVDINLTTQLSKNPLSYPVAGYGNHIIVDGLTQPFGVEWTMPLEPGGNSGEFNYKELVVSGQTAWAQPIKEIIESGKVQRPEASQVRRQTIGAVVSKGVNPAAAGRGGTAVLKLVVIGASEMLLDGKIDNTPANLFYNAVNWSLDNAQAIIVPPRELKNTPVIMTGLQQRVLLATLVFLLPSLIFFGGLGYTILRRRMN